MKNYNQIVTNNVNNIFNRNKAIVLYLVFCIYSNIGKHSDGQKQCELLDILNEASFKQIATTTLYRCIYEIKIQLICEITKKNSKYTQYNDKDFADIRETATLCSCNSLLNLLKAF